MKKQQTLFAAVTMLAVVQLLHFACEPSQQQTARIDEDAIARELKAASEAANAALVAKDMEGYLAHYMDDAVWMPPNAEEFIGKGLARQEPTAVFQAVDIKGESTIEEQIVMGPKSVAVRGQYVVSVTGRERDREPLGDVGGYLTLWPQDTDGQWKIACDMWHSDRGPTLAERAAAKRKDGKGTGGKSHETDSQEVRGILRAGRADTGGPACVPGAGQPGRGLPAGESNPQEDPDAAKLRRV